MLQKVLIPHFTANKPSGSSGRCRELSVATVAVYSSLDHDAVHVRMAEQACASATAARGPGHRGHCPRAVDQRATPVHRLRFFSGARTSGVPITATASALMSPPQQLRVIGDKIRLPLGRREGRHGGSCPQPLRPARLTRQGRRLRRPARWPFAVRRPTVRAAHEGRRCARGPPLQWSRACTAQAYPAGPRSTSSATSAWPRHVEIQVFADQHGTTLWLATATARRSVVTRSSSRSPGARLPRPRPPRHGRRRVKVFEGLRVLQRRDGRFPLPGRQFYFLEMNARLPWSTLTSWSPASTSSPGRSASRRAAARLHPVQTSPTGARHEVRINAEDPAARGSRPRPAR